MDQQKLTLFFDLTETLNYTETAERNFMTQGNVSKKINALEKELGIQLFDRSNRQIKLTEDGQLILEDVKRIVTDYQILEANLTKHREKKERVLTVHTIPTMPNYLGFDLLTSFLRQHPEVHLNLQESEAMAMDRIPLEEKNSVYFFRSLDKLNAQNYITTEEDHFVAVLPKAHPLAKNSTITLSDLQAENFLLLGQASKAYYSVMELCHSVGFEPQVTYQGTRIDLILKMIEQGLGISLIMEKSLGNSLSDQLVLREIAPTQESYLYFYLSEEADAPEPKLFLRYLQDKYSNVE